MTTVWIGWSLICMGFSALAGFVFTHMWLEPKLWQLRRLHEKERAAHEATTLRCSDAEARLAQISRLAAPRS